MAEVVAVAIVFDGSAGLGAQWPTVLNYVNQLLQRLSEQHKTVNYNIAVVSYGSADQHPSPILLKRYFNHPKVVIPELQKDIRVTTGRCKSGEESGLAALEAYAAAIELFDLFMKQLGNISSHHENAGASQDPKYPIPICHIIHIACNPHDESIHPLWNQSTELDDLSWSTLNEELGKRSINLNIILSKQIPQWIELHHRIVPEPCKPWMSIKGDCTLLLAAQSAWTLGPGSKRAVDMSTPETSPDSKRAKVEPSSPSPVKVTEVPKVEIKPSESSSAPPASGASDVSMISNSNSSTSSNSNANVPASGSLSTGRPNVPFQVAIASVLQKVKSVELEISTALTTMRAAKAAGRIDEAQKLEEEIKAKMEVRKKVRSMLDQLSKAGRARAEQMHNSQSETKGETTQPSQSTSQLSAAPPPPSSGDCSSTSSSSTATQPPASLPQASAQSKPPIDRQAIVQLMQNRFSQPLPEQKPLLPTGNRSGANIPPNVAAQMEKLLQQQTGRAGILPNTQQTSSVQNTNVPSSQQPQTLLGRAERQRWSGSLTWTGFDHTVQRKIEVSAQVVVQSQQGQEMRIDLWPPNLNLVPSPEPMVSVPDLKEWVKSFKPIICSVNADPRVPDAMMNITKFQSLHTLLDDKKVYALASWVVPTTGKMSTTVMFFPGPNKQLAAAAFPESGIPELPKPGIAGGIPPSTSPAKLGIPGLNPAQEKEYRERLMAIHRAQLQAQANMAGAPTGLPGGMNMPNGMWQPQGLANAGEPGMMPQMGNALSAMLVAQQQQHQHQQHQQQHQQHQQQALQHNPALNMGAGNIGQAFANMMGGGMNPAGMNVNAAAQFAALQGQQQRAMGGGMGLPQGMPGPNNMPNLSYDMLQSFMQRNAGGMDGMK